VEGGEGRVLVNVLIVASDFPHVKCEREMETRVSISRRLELRSGDVGTRQ
jgi:hypothetical protein